VDTSVLGHIELPWNFLCPGKTRQLIKYLAFKTMRTG